MTIAVKKRAKLDNKFLKSCPIVLDFFTSLSPKYFVQDCRHQVSFYLWWIGSVLKYRNVPKYYDQDCRTRCEICSKLTIKTPKPFWYCWLWTCIYLLGSYLHFYCLDDFHYLDHFHCLHDLQKNEISLGVSHISIFLHNASWWHSRVEGYH